MARRTITLEEKIEKTQEEVAVAKEKYDKAIDALEKLLIKRKERDSKELIDAFTASDKSLADVIEFLQTTTDEEC